MFINVQNDSILENQAINQEDRDILKLLKVLINQGKRLGRNPRLVLVVY